MSQSEGHVPMHCAYERQMIVLLRDNDFVCLGGKIATAADVNERELRPPTESKNRARPTGFAPPVV
jgi:hypothetical protein